MIKPNIINKRPKIDNKKFVEKVNLENPNTINDLEDFMQVLEEAIKFSEIGKSGPT